MLAQMTADRAVSHSAGVNEARKALNAVARSVVAMRVVARVDFASVQIEAADLPGEGVVTPVGEVLAKPFCWLSKRGIWLCSLRRGRARRGDSYWTVG